MTREDAWRKAKGYLYDALNGEEADEIIKALEQPCKDTISRDKAIVQLSHNKIGDDDCDVIIQKDIETIKALPPATPQQKTGRWILTQRDKCIDICCSECGNARFKDYAYGYTIDELDSDEIINDMIAKVRTNYCECCGAKMEGAKDES